MLQIQATRTYRLAHLMPSYVANTTCKHLPLPSFGIERDNVAVLKYN